MLGGGGSRTATPTISVGNSIPPMKVNVSIPGGSSKNQTSNGYTPATITVNVGDTVNWINNDNVVHTVTSVDGNFTSGDLTAGQMFSHTFTTAGTYTYHCKYYTWMQGTVIVKSVPGIK